MGCLHPLYLICSLSFRRPFAAFQFSDAFISWISKRCIYPVFVLGSAHFCIQSRVFGASTVQIRVFSILPKPKLFDYSAKPQILFGFFFNSLFWAPAACALVEFCDVRLLIYVDIGTYIYVSLYRYVYVYSKFLVGLVSFWCFGMLVVFFFCLQLHKLVYVFLNFFISIKFFFWLKNIRLNIYKYLVWPFIMYYFRFKIVMHGNQELKMIFPYQFVL